MMRYAAGSIIWSCVLRDVIEGEEFMTFTAAHHQGQARCFDFTFGQLSFLHLYMHMISGQEWQAKQAVMPLKHRSSY